MSTQENGFPECSKLRLGLSHENRLLTIRLANGKGNICDGELMREMHQVLDQVAETPGIRAILLTAEGDHFSFGASVPEHAPDHVQEMLGIFHGLSKAMVHLHVPMAAAVRGQCLGGGMEIATLCHWVFAAPDAHFAQPEIQLAVFAPVASIVLRRQIGGARADDLLLTGRSISADTAVEWGLIHGIHEDPEQAAIAYLERHILPRSGVALRIASQVARSDLECEICGGGLDGNESTYLQSLMATHDAVEGITSFLERRKPVWTDR
jgi:cyclohexa-1,5-dienecarbonyl-CoA hydratase